MLRVTLFDIDEINIRKRKNYTKGEVRGKCVLKDGGVDGIQSRVEDSILDSSVKVFSHFNREKMKCVA
jgi:hypothetical protein